MDVLLQSVQSKFKLHLPCAGWIKTSVKYLFANDTIFNFLKCIFMFVCFQVNLNQYSCAFTFMCLLFLVSKKLIRSILVYFFFWKSKKRKKRKITSMNFSHNKATN